MDEGRIRALVAETINKPAICALSPDGRLRLFVPRSTTLGEILALRSRLADIHFLFPDGGFVIKPDEDSAMLVAHLNVEASSC